MGSLYLCSNKLPEDAVLPAEGWDRQDGTPLAQLMFSFPRLQKTERRPISHMIPWDRSCYFKDFFQGAGNRASVSRPGGRDAAISIPPNQPAPSFQPFSSAAGMGGKLPEREPGRGAALPAPQLQQATFILSERNSRGSWAREPACWCP